MITTESRTTQQRELDWQRLIDVALEAPGSVGNVYNRFYNYSFLNQMFLRMQGVQEPVATYKHWRALGRQVLKGSKAHAIVRPIVIEKKNADGDVEDQLLRFKPVRCLFTVSQTSGAELPAVEPSSWELDLALHGLRIQRVPYRLIDGNTQGYSTGREYAINPVAVNPTHTTFHEVGHIVLGHTEPDARADYVAHRGVKEFQAEAVAYLTLNEVGLLDEQESSHSRGYIQGWLAEQRPSDVAIRQVFAATNMILQAGRIATSEAAGSPDV